MPNNKPSSEFISTRRAAAVEMKQAGKSFDEIAQRTGYLNAESAQRDVNRVLADIARIPTEESKALELLRIDGLLIAFWPDAMQGKVAAAGMVVKLIELRAKLIGLYAPVQVEQVTMDAVEAEIKRLERELGGAAKKAVRRSRIPREASGGSQESSAK